MGPFDYQNDGLLGGASNPAAQGLLAAGLGLLAGSRGGNAAAALGTSGLAGLQAFQQAQSAGDMRAYRQAQIRKIEQDTEKNSRIMAALGRITGAGDTMLAPGGAPAGSPTAAGPLLAGAVPAGSPGLLGGAAPSGGGGAGGGFNLTLPDVIALKAMGGPDLFEAYKYATDGIKREAGASYRNPLTGAMEYTPKVGEGMELVYGPNGPMVRAIPGYTASNAAAEGAKAGAVAGAQSQFDLVDVPDGNGGTVKMSRADALQRLGGRGAGTGAPGAGGRGLGTDPGQTARDTDKLVNTDWMTNSYRPTLDDGKAATDLSNSLRAFRTIPLETGWGTETKAAAANFLTSLGVAPEEVQQYASNAQKFQSIAMDRLQKDLMMQKGPQTEGDADRASKTFTRLSNTPQANQFIADLAQAQVNQRIRKAQYYEAALPLAQRSGDLARVDREWRKVQGSIWNDPILAPYRPQEQK